MKIINQFFQRQSAISHELTDPQRTALDQQSQLDAANNFFESSSVVLSTRLHNAIDQAAGGTKCRDILPLKGCRYCP